ncbi:oligosaccharide flippase family protein [Shewanella sp. SM23]|uniref:oligosaccharide flippase family protein n=1 Tax=Shewanella sp. SM23 TaxID=2912794 RepID=UPI0021D83C64|nr:oligosaccharide flippase family protein [Shewanella sp. SM23]MCU8082685.1 oligosaccharide flippase family protein [Shewanella sp. SM23]
MIKSLIRQSSVVLLFKLFGSANAFFLTILITNGLGANASGGFFFVISILAFLTSITTFGLPVGLVNLLPKSLSKNNDDVFKVVVSSIIMVLFFSGVVILGLFLVEPFVGNKIITDYKFEILLSLIPFALLIILSSVFQSLEKVSFAMLMLNVLYQAILTGIIVILRPNTLLLVLDYFIISLWVSLVVGFCYFFWCFRKCMKYYFDLNHLLFLVGFASTFMITNSLGQFSNFWISYNLSIFSNTDSIAVFSVAVRIALIISLVSFALNKVTAQKISTLANVDDRKKLYRIISVSVLIVFLVVSPILLVSLLFPDKVLVLFGEEFVSGTLILSVIMVGQYFASITGVNSFVLQMTGSQSVMKNIAISSLSISILISYFAISTYGLLGAALSYSFNLCLIGTLSSLYVYKLTGYNIFKFLTYISK